jgi:glucosamine--fructose-6-phosphate aminotransferase (isomerizing)
MCGIFGCTLKDGRAAELIHHALKRLEYRGYDSVGQATIADGRLFIKKDKGRIEEVHSSLNLDDMQGKVGIGHTRWATHGAPSHENAHPHTDCQDQVAIVHNGIIENFAQLRSELEQKGHTFKSRTDSEIVAHLIEDNLKAGQKFREAVRLALKKLEGSYAIAAVTPSSPDEIVCARRESPLIVSCREDASFCASDTTAILPLSKTAIALGEGEMAVLRPGCIDLMKVIDGEAFTKEPFEIAWSYESAQKGGYPHFMLKEIHEQPQAVRDALRTQQIYHDLMATNLLKAKKIFLVACGTSYHACLAASYAFTKLAKTPCQVAVASEFNDQYGELIDQDTAVVGVSQSGETSDTLSAIREAKKKGAVIMSVTNVMGSTMTTLSDVYIGQNSGPEIGVAATKTFTAQVAVLMRLAISLALRKRTITDIEAKNLIEQLENIPKFMEDTIKGTERLVKTISLRYRSRPSFAFLGRGISVVTAMEGRLKLLELSYIPSLAYPAAESKHGFIAVVDQGYPVIFVVPNDENRRKVFGNIMEMKAREACIISLAETGDVEVEKLADDFVPMPTDVPELFSPLTYIIPLQLLAYYISTMNGHDVDHPRNLAKSVTVE